VVWAGHLGRGYTAAVYNKGPYAFHVMRMTWGDEKFFKFLKTLAQDLKNKDIVTRDIQRVAEKSFGGNMDFFFDQWLRGVGNPEYTFNYSVRETEDQKYMLQGTVDQRVLIGTKKDLLEGQYFTAVVPITVVGKSGKEYRIPLRVQGAKTPFQQKLPEAPKEVTFNKYGESLAYDVIVNKVASN
jgi:aminopeptidase N